MGRDSRYVIPSIGTGAEAVVKGHAVCTVCSHPAQAEIDAALVGLVSQRVVAKHYDLSLAAVNRHKLNHLSAAVVMVTPLAELAALGPVRPLLDRLEGLIAGAEEFLNIARQSGNAHVGLAAIRECRTTLELIAKITGELNERPVVIVNLETSQEWQAMRGSVVQVLQRHPDALAEVREVLRLGDG